MSSLLYKVLPREEWRQAEAEGVFRGSGIDLADGYIHLSSATQVVETVRLHFAGQHDLVLVAVDDRRISESLRWEKSRGGAEFPHLYGELPLTAVTSVRDLPLEGDAHQFPDEL